MRKAPLCGTKIKQAFAGIFLKKEKTTEKESLLEVELDAAGGAVVDDMTIMVED